MNLALWIPSFGLPVVALLINVIVRIANKLPQSALPDMILCFVVFDALVAMESHHFDKYIQWTWVKGAVPHYFGLWAITNMAVWFIAVTTLEYRLIARHRAGHGYLNLPAMGILFSSLILASLVAFFSILPFVYKGQS